MSTADLKSYRPGTWFGIFGERSTVLLPASEKPRIAALWALVDDGADFEEVLDALIAGGLRQLPGFVLVSDDGETTRLILRGSARASLSTANGDVVEVDGSGALTWVERSLPGLRSLRVVLEESDGDDLMVAGGLVRVGQVDAPPYEPEPEPIAIPEPEPEPEPEPAPEPEPIPEPEPEPEPIPEPEPEPEPVPEPEPEPVPELDLDPPTEAFPAPEPPPPGPVWGRGPAAVVADLEDDGLTRPGGFVSGQFARQQPGIPGQPPAPEVTARPVARLSFSGGETIDVDRVILVGRAPEARRFSSTEQPRLVSVTSPNQEISSTHLEIRPGSGVDHGSAIVTDMGSTNGTVLVQPGLAPEDLQPGIPVQLMPGAIIDLGDGVTISVTNP